MIICRPFSLYDDYHLDNVIFLSYQWGENSFIGLPDIFFSQIMKFPLLHSSFIHCPEAKAIEVHSFTSLSSVSKSSNGPCAIPFLNQTPAGASLEKNTQNKNKHSNSQKLQCPYIYFGKKDSLVSKTIYNLVISYSWNEFCMKVCTVTLSTIARSPLSSVWQMPFASSHVDLNVGIQ